jgi:hypothetical protein
MDMVLSNSAFPGSPAVLFQEPFRVAKGVKCLAIDLKFLVREHGSPRKPRYVLRQARFPIKVAT